AVLEAGYIACHPTNDGVVAAGFQDNGTARRVGDTVWRQDFAGDGGGVVFDPRHEKRYFRQYILADWSSSDDGAIPPVNRRRPPDGNGKTSEKVENDACRFYSGAAAIDHGGESHLLFGTDRIWYSRDWARSWVTLPT